MFSFVFVCLLAGLLKNFLTDFYKIWWKGGTWTTERIDIDFSGNWITLRDC